MTTLTQEISQIAIDPEPAHDSTDTMPVQIQKPVPSFAPLKKRRQAHVAHHLPPAPPTIPVQSKPFDQFAPATYSFPAAAKLTPKWLLAVFAASALAMLAMRVSGDEVMPVFRVYGLLFLATCVALFVALTFEAETALDAVCKAYGVTVLDAQPIVHVFDHRVPVTYVRGNDRNVYRAVVSYSRGRAFLLEADGSKVIGRVDAVPMQVAA
ncbi:hypothetical protein [Bifidobacterium sp. SO1]|uniref:hypothetical protein n=1 Tax=Bifidobacterium sp. SO1 TaxID=2809029 RepID=UPI001BDC49AB|nr:hypothetical protein [Bifidobacterium sp. SO1]MBT1162216.1 hypothetical protein [Bifidobacterium sp. SO1]